MRFFGLLIFFSVSALGADTYRNFAELSAQEEEGRDFAVTAEKRNSPFLVLAIHGGRIEPGTSELARLIAGEDLSFYLFEGLKESENRSLHVTSSAFDEPRALKLTGDSDTCLSLHGFKNDRAKELCLGGANEALVRAFRHALGVLDGLRISYFCRGMAGREGTNIVNRCKGAGVQLEISSSYRKLLEEKPSLAQAFARKVRAALLSLNSKLR